MFERAKRFERGRHDNQHGGGAVATAEREHTARHDHDGDGVADRREGLRETRARQRDEFGGFNWGSAFFGWLVAVGLAALLTSALSGAGAAIGLSKDSAETIGIVGGILMLAVLMLSYYCGGYVAGRMSRFDGARQGFGVWLFGLLATLIIGAIGAILGSEYNVLQKLDLPRLPVDEGALTTGGIIALVAIVLGTLIAAIAGGKVGQRYHHKVDRAGMLDPRDRAVA